ncbi:MAG: sigma-54 dependent transcriptional regulator [Candidatus Adiutrix sp.]|jgi:two-component system response regulator HydG|nr:sigma-54 dependent transcriptional regulator [Candidatus Adiutrix sp.]
MTCARPKAPILIVDDDPEHLFMLKTVLGDWGRPACAAKSGREALLLAGEKNFDLILMDVRMKDLDGLSALEALKSEGRNRNTPVIIMTAYSKVEDAVRALKAGAYDYLTKPLDLDLVRISLERALEHRNLKEEKEAGLWSAPESDGLIGQSPAMRAVADMIDLVAGSEATVLITGESGVGKEVAARAIQRKSARADKPFVIVNCAALAENLLEAELFGHEKGAFTGAERRREGRLKAADGGTLFLDEIGETSPALQAKLLRAIQEGEIQPVGSDETEIVDVRFIAAANRDLKAEVAAGRFRADLFWRLNVVNLKIPPLRDRPEDLPALTQFFIRRYALKNRKEVKGLSPGALALISRHKWPGNIRELQNAVERAVILMRGEYLTEKDLPDLSGAIGVWPQPEKAAEAAPDLPAWPLNLEDLEKMAVGNALTHTGGNKSRAAETLGVARKTLFSTGT